MINTTMHITLCFTSVGVNEAANHAQKVIAAIEQLSLPSMTAHVREETARTYDIDNLPL